MKKALVIAPAMPANEHMSGIVQSLYFLSQAYKLEFVDPLTKSYPLGNEAYYRLWQDWLMPQLATFELLIGFSFGGVILQQCFPLIHQFKQIKIILFSTPSFVDESLQKKLNRVLDLLELGAVDEAMTALYQEVYRQGEEPVQLDFMEDKARVKQRMAFGLKRVLQTDSRNILERNRMSYLHLVGEESALVSQKQVICLEGCKLVSVPKAGMRVLEDNPQFCQEQILDWLKND